MTRRVAFIVALAAGLAALTIASTVGAAEPQAAGWWHQAVTDAPDTGAPTPSLPAQTRPTAVPVPTGGLYVANDPTGPRAISALQFDGHTGRAVLTLHVDANSIVPFGARIVACAVMSRWEPIAGGRFDQRPEADCSGGVHGAFVDDRSAVAFEFADLGAFATGRGIEVALVPATDEVATFDLVFEPPNDDSLRILDAAPSPTSVVPDSDRRPVVNPVDATIPPLPPALVPAPPSTAVPAVDDTAHVVSRPAPRPTAALVTFGTDGPLRAAATALLASAAAGIWFLSGRRPTRVRMIHSEVAP